MTTAEAPRTVVGTQPLLPPFLARWPWWTEPVRAERLASLRIGMGAVLLFDVLVTYLPFAGAFFGANGLGDPAVFAQSDHPFWSPVWARMPWRGLAGPWITVAWAAAAFTLLLGAWSRFSAFVCWFFGMTAMSLAPPLQNAGDLTRNIILFYLMLSPCGAVWSADAWLAGRRGAVWIWPWALRLLFLQLVCIYGFNGLQKLIYGEGWRAGSVIYSALNSLEWSRFSYGDLPVRSYLLTQLLTWAVLAWEVLFPVLVLWGPTRMAALWMGVAFHVGLASVMEVGMFAPYALTLYLPFVPWERWCPTGEAAGGA